MRTTGWMAVVCALTAVTGAPALAQDKPAVQLKTVNELKTLSADADRHAKADGRAAHIWGDMNIPPLVVPKGKVLYEDGFANLDNWHHEGIGQLTAPEPGVFELACLGSKQGAEGCMAFCRTDFPDNVCIEYDMRALSNKGLVITFIAAQGRHGEDMITGLPPRKGVFADYIHNPDLRCYHLSVSRYNDKGEHTGVSNWRRNPGIFLMAQQPDLCKVHNTWYRIAIVKQGKLLQLSVNGEPAGGFIDRNDIPEPLPTAGKVGFRTIGADVRVQFRNFKVTALE